jgi:hypothetical protein
MNLYSTYADNTRNESVRKLRIRKMNLCIYGEYAEGGKSSNRSLPAIR